MNKFTLITSTGRTGTMFFRDYLSQTCENTICLHEPTPSRVFRLLSNLTLAGKIPTSVSGNLFRSMRSRLSRGYDNYIESSNFLFGCIPSLNECFDSVRIIHLTRHPVTYAQSHMAHGFWRGSKKWMTKFLPYWFEGQDTPKQDPYILLFLRWAYMNKIIATSEQTNPYLRVKFEDLFSSNREDASEHLNKIRDFLGFSPTDVLENTKWLETPRNASRKKEALDVRTKYEEFICDNIASELKAFDYSI